MKIRPVGAHFFLDRHVEVNSRFSQLCENAYWKTEPNIWNEKYYLKKKHMTSIKPPDNHDDFRDVLALKMTKETTNEMCNIIFVLNSDKQ